MPEFTPPVVTSPPPASAPTFTVRKSNFGTRKIYLMGSALLALLLIGVLVASMYIRPLLSPYIQNLFSAARPTLVVYGRLPIGTVYELTAGTTTPQKLVVEGAQGKSILDMVQDKTQTYYLLLSADKLSSNIYVSSGSHTALTQLTSSNTLKYQLSFEPKTKTFIYTSGKIANEKDVLTKSDWMVESYSLRTHTEKSLVEGTDPHFLRGSAIFTYITPDSIFLGNSGTSTSKVTETKLLSNLNHGPYAANPSGTRLAYYEPMTRNVLVYVIGSNLLISFEHAVPVSYPVTSLTFRSDEDIEITGHTSLQSSSFQTLGKKEITSYENPYILSVPQKIIVLHD